MLNYFFFVFCYVKFKSSQVTFMFIALYTIQIVYFNVMFVSWYLVRELIVGNSPKSMRWGILEKMTINSPSSRYF